MQPNGNDRIFTVSEAAAHLKVTTQSLFSAIRKGRLKAERQVIINQWGQREVWVLRESAIKAYHKDKYNPENRKSHGQQIVDREKGRLSVSAAAEYMQCSVSKVHYLIRTGKIKSSRIGTFFYLEFKDVWNYCFPEKEKIFDEEIM